MSVRYGDERCETPLCWTPVRDREAGTETRMEQVRQESGRCRQISRRGRQQRPSPEPQRGRDGGSGLGEALVTP